MLIRKSFKYELDPNETQRRGFSKHAGVSRFSFNWGLARRIRYYRLFKKSVGSMRLKKHLNKFKLRKFPWMGEVSTYAMQSSIENLDRAFISFFDGLKKGQKVGFPKFKKKGRSRDSFRLYGAIRVHENHVDLPRIGTVKLKEESKVEGAIKSMTVSREADRWYVSINVEHEVEAPKENTKPACGIDLGLASFATIASERVNGSIKIRKIRSPKPLAKKLRRLKILQRRVERKKKGSNNRKKAVLKLSRCHRRIRCFRQNFLHKLSNEITKNHGVIRIESLNVKGMMGSNLAKSISDAGWSEFVRQLEYKSIWKGSKIEKADRFYPSSKLCSSCGIKMESLPLSIREWTCPHCGVVHDRDGNAAINLLRNTPARIAANAFGLASCGGTEEIPVNEQCRVEKGIGEAEKPIHKDRRRRSHPCICGTGELMHGEK